MAFYILFLFPKNLEAHTTIALTHQPTPKKKDDMDKENYRPISILAVFSKVFESMIAE